MTLPQISWRKVLRSNITNINALAAYLQLSAAQRAQLVASKRFALNLPMRLARKMAKGTLDDPLLRQYVPFKQEESSPVGFVQDPVGDRESCVVGKLLQKYHGRALLLCTSACAMHCRYCFRQHYPYAPAAYFTKELAAIASDISIKEVILSGGDPLSLGDTQLASLLTRLAGIAHVKRIRFHTRFPIGIPERIQEDFLALVRECPQAIYFVIHCNHPLELDDEVLHALNEVRLAGATLLNQSVLLRGVNDCIDTLEELNTKLVDNHIQPYYLHQLDRVQGAWHFEVNQEEGLSLIRALRKRLPGYAVPLFVCEEAGMPSKTPL